MIEAMRRAYCDRARFLGDPAFVKIPQHLTSREHARQLAKTIDLGRAAKSADLAKDIPEESYNSTRHALLSRLRTSLN
jgi:gamma-glutamyltranspeptidase/glutathione hydrolase